MTNKLQPEWNEFMQILAGSNKLYAEGMIKWLEAILKEYGNIQINWSREGCILGNGEVYKF